MIDPKSSETTGYHLFLMPEGVLKDQLQENITRLAEDYEGPVFAPHVTLLEDITGIEKEEVIAKAKMLGGIIHRFPILFGAINTEDTFFRSVYVRAENSLEFTLAHTKARELFRMQDDADYMPHLSLFYGNVTPETKEEMIDSLALPEDLAFIVDKIHIYKTEGPATEWVPVGEVALQ